jgi:LysM repeat protein
VRTAPVLRAVPSATARPADLPKRRLRLTRRGRFVLVVLPALAVLSGALVTSTARVAEAAPAPVPAVHVTVGAGDSLWAVAQRVAPRQDPRNVVIALERANGLEDANVEAGQVLVVPAAVLAR